VRAEQKKLTADAVAKVMATIKAEQELMAEARAEQMLRKDQLMAEIDMSRASSEVLRKANEELR